MQLILLTKFVEFNNISIQLYNVSKGINKNKYVDEDKLQKICDNLYKDLLSYISEFIEIQNKYNIELSQKNQNIIQKRNTENTNNTILTSVGIISGSLIVIYASYLQIKKVIKNKYFN